jgi:DNA-binding NtrC family response regulator
MQKPFILVADDEALVAETLVEILTGEGFTAVAVKDGLAAVTFVRERKPDIVICDVVMPNLNGIEAAKQICEIAPDTRIILFSGQAATMELLQEAEDCGFSFEILPKPIKPERLLSTIARILNIENEVENRNNNGQTGDRS